MSSFRSLFCQGLLALALASSSACHIPDEDNIEVSVQVDNVQIALAAATFGKQIGGSFDLTATLGELAQQPSNVKWEKFALTKADTNEELLVLSIASDVPTNVDVPKGTTQKLPIRLETKVLDAAAVIALCTTQVRVAGATFDSATSRTKPAYSVPFTVSGCNN